MSDVPFLELLTSMEVTELEALWQRLRGHASPDRISRSEARGRMSFQQERMWVLEQLSRGGAYHLPVSMRLRGELDVGALERGLREVARRHEVLRTRLVTRGGEPVQEVVEEWEQGLEVEEVVESELEVRLREEASRGFELERGPLVRWRLLKLGERE